MIELSILGDDTASSFAVISHTTHFFFVVATTGAVILIAKMFDNITIDCFRRHSTYSSPSHPGEHLRHRDFSLRRQITVSKLFPVGINNMPAVLLEEI